MTDRDSRTTPTAHFLRADVLTTRARRRPIQGAFSVSVLIHALGVIILALAVSPSPGDDQRSTATSNSPAQIVWLPQSGPPHGGGGGGNGQPEPARRAQAPGHDTLTVPAVRGESAPTDTARRDQKMQILAVSTMADIHDLPGIVTPVSGRGQTMAVRAGNTGGPRRSNARQHRTDVHVALIARCCAASLSARHL
jgi:hypothetical protein